MKDHIIAVIYSSNINNKATKSHSLANSLSSLYNNIEMISLNDLLISLSDISQLNSIVSDLDYIVLDQSDLKQVDNASEVIQVLEQFAPIIYIDTNAPRRDIIQKIKLSINFYNRKEDNNLIYLYKLFSLESDVEFLEDKITILDINNIEDYELYYYLLNRDEAFDYDYKLWAKLAGILYAESKAELKKKHREYLETKLERLYLENKNIISTIDSLKEKHLRYNKQINNIKDKLS